MSTLSRWARLLLVSFTLVGCDAGEPEQVTDDIRPKSVAELACEPDEVRFALGCAQVQDERIVVRAPRAALVWTVALDDDKPNTGDLFSGAVEASGRFVVRDLTPWERTHLVIRTRDARGAERRYEVAVTMREPMNHLVLNEVYADPLGSEPAQEWIELYNDGLADVETEGMILRDEQGDTVLPSAVVQREEYLLVMRKDLKLNDGVDQAIPACDTLKVNSLGKNGLGNSGERLSLIDKDGTMISQFLPTSASKEGQSAARVKPDAFDDDPAAFAHTPHVTPCDENTF